MDSLEELIRDSLREHAADAPDAAGLTERATGPQRPGRRTIPARWAAVAAAVIAVVAVAVGATALNHHSSTPSTRRTLPPIPAGEKAISYHGVEILVPGSLPMGGIDCGLVPRTGLVSVDFGYESAGGAGCLWHPSPTAPGQTYVLLAPTGTTIPAGPGTPTSVIGGSGTIRYQPNPELPGVLGVLTVTGPGVTVSVTTPTHAQTAALLATVRVTPVDRLGCLSHRDSFVPSGNASATSVVPPGASSATLCEYQGDDNAAYDGWLMHSELLLDQSTLAAFSRGLDALPAFTKAAPPEADEYWVTFAYPDGTKRVIDYDEYTFPAPVTDGQRTVGARAGDFNVFDQP